ncbi:MAG: ABC transporter permease subunit [Eubacteriales bacterium]
MLAIYKRELKSYFTSMIGCLFIALFIAVASLYFMVYNLISGYTYFSYALYSTSFVLMIAIPILTMKCFAEERKNKTEQLLMTAPTNLTSIVFGKYLAMTTVFAIPNIVFCVFPLIIQSYGIGHLTVDYLAILTFYLLGCTFIAVSMYLSSLTESQVIAAVGGFGALFILYMWDGIVGFIPFTALQEILAEYSLMESFSNIAANTLFDITGVVLYLSVAGCFIFLTIQTLQKRRWS